MECHLIRLYAVGIVNMDLTLLSVTLVTSLGWYLSSFFTGIRTSAHIFWRNTIQLVILSKVVMSILNALKKLKLDNFLKAAQNDVSIFRCCRKKKNQKPEAKLLTSVALIGIEDNVITGRGERMSQSETKERYFETSRVLVGSLK